MIRFSITDSLNEQEGYYFLRTVLHPHATVPRWSMTAAGNAARCSTWLGDFLDGRARLLHPDRLDPAWIHAGDPPSNWRTNWNVTTARYSNTATRGGRQPCWAWTVRPWRTQWPREMSCSRTLGRRMNLAALPGQPAARDNGERPSAGSGLGRSRQWGHPLDRLQRYPAGPHPA